MRRLQTTIRGATVSRDFGNDSRDFGRDGRRAGGYAKGPRNNGGDRGRGGKPFGERRGGKFDDRRDGKPYGERDRKPYGKDRDGDRGAKRFDGGSRDHGFNARGDRSADAVLHIRRVDGAGGRCGSGRHHARRCAQVCPAVQKNF